MTPIFLANEGGGTYCSHEKYIYSTKAQALFNWKINQQYSDIYIYLIKVPHFSSNAMYQKSCTMCLTSAWLLLVKTETPNNNNKKKTLDTVGFP